MREGSRFWLFVLLVTSLTLSANALSAETFLNIKAKAFDQDKVRQNSKAFEVSSEGLITDGPRQAAGEPIDYSSILQDEFLEDMFFQTVVFCIEGVRYCGDKFFRLPSKEFRLKVVSQTSNNSDIMIEVEKSLSNTLDRAGFKIAKTDDQTAFLFVIVVGDIKYLEKYASKINDAYGKEFFNYYFPTKRHTGPALFFDPCYLATKARNQGESALLIEYSYLETCLPRLLLAAIGLHETAGGGTPTATSADGDYRVLTLADKSFIKTLYAPGFPIYGSGKEVIHYYKENLSQNGNFKSP